jgi:hypothetical protein
VSLFTIRDVTDEEPLIGVAYPDSFYDDEPGDVCEECGEEVDDFGRCACDDEPWFDEDQGQDE